MDQGQSTLQAKLSGSPGLSFRSSLRRLPQGPCLQRCRFLPPPDTQQCHLHKLAQTVPAQSGEVQELGLARTQKSSHNQTIPLPPASAFLKFLI